MADPSSSCHLLGPEPGRDPALLHPLSPLNRFCHHPLHLATGISSEIWEHSINDMQHPTLRHDIRADDIRLHLAFIIHLMPVPAALADRDRLLGTRPIVPWLVGEHDLPEDSMILDKRLPFSGAQVERPVGGGESTSNVSHSGFYERLVGWREEGSEGRSSDVVEHVFCGGSECREVGGPWVDVG